MNRKYLPLLLLGILSLAIPLTVFLSQRVQNLRQKAASPTDNFIETGTMNLTATYDSIGIELFFTGDANKNAKAQLEFKKKTETNWRKGLELWGTYATTAPGPAFYGSALLLNAGTEYDVRITIADSDGVTGTSVITGSITTRADNIPAASSLTPTHFVRTDGNDTNTGTSDSPTGAWKTVQKALSSAPAGTVVQVGPGSYALPKLVRTTPITIKAQYPAVDDNQSVINNNRQSVIEPQATSNPNQGTWVQVPHGSLVGPGSGASFPRSGETLWKWTNAPITDFITTLNVARNRTATEVPFRVNRWARDTAKILSGYHMQTPEGWAEILFLNGSYTYGFTTFGKDIYMRLPGDKNPNDYYTWISNGFDDENALRIRGENVRMSGFQIRMHTLQYEAVLSSGITTLAKNGIFDHNLLYNTKFKFVALKSGVYPSDFTIEHNRAYASGYWSTDPEWPGMPWWFIKGGVGVPGVTGTWGVGKPEETDGTFIYGRGGAHRLVLRNNYIDGYFNGVSGFNSDYNRYTAQDTDIHNNTFRQVGDDVFEPEGQAINWRAWNNYIEHSSVFTSVGPVNWGPLYIFRNTTSNIGNHGMTRTISTNDPGVFGKFFKYSGSSGITARLWVINNTFHNVTPGFDGADNSAGGGSTPESFYLRNNILTATRYIWSNGPFGEPRLWNEDYNHFYTSDPGNRGLRDRTNISWYRSSWPPNGIHSNIAADLKDPWIFNQFMNDDIGDMRLVSTSSLINAGTPIPNIYDNYDEKSSYVGTAPDLGALESGSITTPPTVTPSITTTPTRTPTAAATITPTLSPTAALTSTPTSPTVSPTPRPSGTPLFVTLKLHGLGTGGDVVNPTSSGNMNPLRTSRSVVVEIYNALNNQLASTANGILQYYPNTGVFNGTIVTQTVLPASGYNLRITSPGYLTGQLLGVSINGATILPSLSLTTGDINNDKTLDILDYNLLVSCYGAVGTTKPATCTGNGHVDADLFDDGNVNFIDLNLWLREFSKKS